MKAVVIHEHGDVVYHPEKMDERHQQEKNPEMRR